MDITTEILKGASPYIASINYDLLNRSLELIAVDDPDKMNPCVKAVFPGITKFLEEVDEIDDDNIDSVVGIHWMNKHRICIRTEVRELIITLTGKPYAEQLT